MVTSRLAEACQPLAAAHPGLSGVITLPEGHDALAARALLADVADRTLDVQYYIWRADAAGILLFERLRRAADRGVRVRLLLDDNSTGGLDPLLAALDAHPNIEIRLFNPFKQRRWRLLGYLTDFKRLNRRMHNKSFTADGQATIIGGRNIGDEYFDVGRAPWFVDLDVLAIGPVVHDVATCFECYWTSASAVPLQRVVQRPGAAPEDLAAEAAKVERDSTATRYLAAVARTGFVRDLLNHRLPFDWAETHLVSDDPAKGLGHVPTRALLWPRLKEELGEPAESLLLVSPYFVPGSAGVAALAELAGRGVAVTVLTNALEATDVAVVHAGYAKRRVALLAAGVTLFELKRLGEGGATDAIARTGRIGSGSSASSLHAKTVAVDRARVFVGSFNFDPRSIRLNTEMGFVIASPALAESISALFIDDIPAKAYRVRLAPDGSLEWISQTDGQTVVQHTEPGTSLWQRLVLRLLEMLPVEWLL